LKKDGFYVIWNYQNAETMTFLENYKKKIPAGKFRDRRFAQIPKWEFPVALVKDTAY